MKKKLLLSLMLIPLLGIALTAKAADPENRDGLFSQEENQLSIKLDEKDLESLSQALSDDKTEYNVEITLNDKTYSGILRQADNQDIAFPGGPDGKAPMGMPPEGSPDGKAPMGMPPEGGPNGKAPMGMPPEGGPDGKPPMGMPPEGGPDGKRTNYIIEFKLNEEDKTASKFLIQLHPQRPDGIDPTEMQKPNAMPEPPDTADMPKHFPVLWSMNDSEPMEAEITEIHPKEK